MELRDLIRRILRSNMPLIEGLSTAETFPYAGENHEPQQLDPITDYVLDWNKFSSNNSVFEFPKAEFDLGLKIERNKDAKGKIMDVARKVIDNLSVDPTFYSNIKDRKQ